MTTAADLAVPPPPRRPSPHARRMLFRYQGEQKAQLIVGAAFLIMGLVMGPMFAAGSWDDLRMRLGAKAPVSGTVDETHLMKKTRVMGRHPLAVAYHYDVSGQRYHGVSYVLADDLTDRAVPGARLPVDVLTTDATLSRLQGAHVGTFAAFGLLVWLWPLAGLGVLIAAVRSNRREIRAFTDGMLVMATVTAAGEDKRVKMGNRHPFRWSYTYEVGGQRHAGAFSSFEPELLPHLQGVETIPVLYLPAKPSVSTVFIP